jgi:hypothetical protein
MLFSNWKKKSIILQVWPKKHCHKHGKGDHKRDDDEQEEHNFTKRIGKKNMNMALGDNKKQREGNELEEECKLRKRMK